MCRRLRRKPESQGRQPANSYAFSLRSLPFDLAPTITRRSADASPPAAPSWRDILAEVVGISQVSRTASIAVLLSGDHSATRAPPSTVRRP